MLPRNHHRIALATLLSIATITCTLAADEPDGNRMTAADVIQRHIEAVGGEDAIRHHSMRTQHGTIEIDELDIKGEIRLYAARPNLLLLVADLGEQGINRTGYNGVVGWSLDEPTGATLLTEARLEELRRQSDFYADLHYERNYSHIELLGERRFHATPCYELKMIDRSGKDVFAYFSKESGLHIGLKGTMESHLGPVPAVTVFADYKPFDGVLLPTTLETTFMDIVQRINITKVSHELIDEAVFDLPSEIVALQEGRSTKVVEPNPEQEVEDGEADEPIQLANRQPAS